MGTVPRPNSQIVPRSQIHCRYSISNTQSGFGSSFRMESLFYCINREKYNEKRILHVIYKGRYCHHKTKVKKWLFKDTVWVKIFLSIFYISIELCSSLEYAIYVFLTSTAVKIALAIKLSKVTNTSAFFYQLLFIHNYRRMTVTFNALMLLE